METLEDIVNEECEVRDGKIVVSDKLEVRLTQLLLFEKANKKYQRQRSSKGFVYLIRQGKYCKIGRATNMQVRLRKYYSENPEPIDLLGHAYVSDYIREEVRIQKKYENRWVRGEWFALTEADITDLQLYFETLKEK